MILFRGGNWCVGFLEQFRVGCAYFATRGLVCTTANNRNLPKPEAKKLPPGESRKRLGRLRCRLPKTHTKLGAG